KNIVKKDAGRFWDLCNNATIFEAASISKSVFAAFVMTFVDEGRLNLDRPLHEYLPYVDIEHDERYRNITARMVLSHRSGFPNWRTDYSDHQLFLAFEPGSDFLYSGEGYQYLAMVLKELEGATWEGLDATFRARVTEPLGMTRTVFMLDAVTEKDKAEPYGRDGSWTNPEHDPNRALRFQFRAAASLHTEALDFSRWMIALANREGLSEAAFSEMFAPHSLVGHTSRIPVHYTLGFYHPKVRGTKLFFHGGNNGDFSSFFALDVNRGWGFALFTNSAFGEDLGNELLFHLVGGPRLGQVVVLLAVVLGIVLVLLGWLGIRFARGLRQHLPAPLREV
ncbi:MAG: beta-lactamase family protein, partial [Opitutales bacterium]|nr:beta-lactamase family protein [Opitutales bacterium]